MAFSYKFPPYMEYSLPSGLGVILVPDQEQDTIVVSLQLPVGRFSDKIGFEGCSEITLGLLKRGTEELSPDKFLEKLENTGAMCFGEMGEEHCLIGIRMLSKFESELIPLFWDMVCKPKFDNDEFNRIQKEMITSLQAEMSEPSLIANRHFYRALAGKDHPAGRFMTMQSVKKIESSMCKDFHREFCSPKNAYLVIAGNINPENFRSKWDSLFGSFVNDTPKESIIASKINNPDKRIVKLIDKPDLSQATVIIGQTAPGEADPTRNAVALANYIFGAGNFSSRLMKQIRSKIGMTYGVTSQISSEKEFGSITINTSTQNKQVPEVISGILDEFKSFVDHGVTADELERAKNYALGNMAFQLEGIENIVEKLLWLRYHKRPDSFIERFDEVLNSISLESVNEAIKRNFSPDKLIITAVGKKKEIGSYFSQFPELQESNYREPL